MEVTPSLIVAFVSIFFLSFPLLFWQMTYSKSNWAILCLVPNALLLYLGFRDVLIPIFEARVQLEMQPKYTKSAFFTARLKANIISVFYVLFISESRG